MISTRGRLPYKSDGDARRLGLGCELQIFVSLRVFGMESYYYLPIQVSLSPAHKEIAKKCSTLTRHKSSLGISLSVSLTHSGLPKGFNLNLLTSITVTFILESSPPPRDDFLLNSHGKLSSYPIFN